MNKNKRSDLHDDGSDVGVQSPNEAVQETRVFKDRNDDIQSSHQKLGMLGKDIIVDCKMGRWDITVQQQKEAKRNGEHNPAIKHPFATLHNVVISQ
jgi:hypothetical protein